MPPPKECRMPPSFVIANWKMYFTHTQSVAWMHQHQHELTVLLKETHHNILICPSYESIASLAHSAKTIPGLAIGAQDCSAHKEGPYTGQVSAQSLKELGATYVLAGHSETRHNFKNSNEITLHKMLEAFAYNLVPIVCIGEARDKYQAGTTLNVIEEQIRPVLEAYKLHNKEMMIAYEPIWAIGTAQVPDRDHLEKVYQYVHMKCARMGIERLPRLLYGGSVDELNVQALSKIAAIDGFVIGKASTDFQKFKKIVQSI